MDDSQIWLQIAQKGAIAEPDNRTYAVTLGAAYYRAGQWEEAVDQFALAAKLSFGGPGGDAISPWFLAMAHHRLGHTEEAGKWFRHAVYVIPNPGSWDQILACKTLRREAETLIYGNPENAKRAAPRTLTIVNQTGKEVSIYYLDNQKEVFYKKLAAGGIYEQVTFPGHRWRAKVANRDPPLELAMPMRDETWELK